MKPAGTEGRYRMYVDKETMKVKVLDIDPIIQNTKENGKLELHKEEMIKCCQFAVVYGLNEEENTVSFKCVDDVNGEEVFLYDDEEAASLYVGPFNPEDGNFADRASFKLRYAFFSYSDERNCSIESYLNKRHFIYSDPETGSCRLELYDGSNDFMVYANWQILDDCAPQKEEEPVFDY